ncbi:small integral membrane protein 8-like [Oratosquilla oratoria]|uniref:small integral membrane protein 8-like n=1 Tax=Oratosquilla oratoria TaxID=337810 RepID=UPI003F76E899
MPTSLYGSKCIGIYAMGQPLTPSMKGIWVQTVTRSSASPAGGTDPWEQLWLPFVEMHRVSKSRERRNRGDGIRSIRTTNVFKVVNFELYAKPNAVIMTFGVIGILGSAAYLAYMKSQHREKKVYVAIAEDGTEELMTKKSKWD